MAVDSFTKTGNKSAAPKLDKHVFNVSKINHGLLNDAYLSYLTNGRKNLAKTKTRTEVRGGGRKPWKQKGTGRARAGSIRSPLWKGGGITFGPTGNESFSKKTNKSTKSTVLRHALSLLNKQSKLKVIEQFALKNISTKELSALLDKIGVSGKILLIAAEASNEFQKSASNLKNVKIISPKYLNTHHLLNSDAVVIDKQSVEDISAKLTDKKSVKENK